MKESLELNDQDLDLAGLEVSEPVVVGLPTPEVLAQYRAVNPAMERMLIENWRAEAKHRRDIEVRIASAGTVRAVFGGLVGATALAGATWAALAGAPWQAVASIVGIPTLGVLAAWFGPRRPKSE